MTDEFIRYTGYSPLRVDETDVIHSSEFSMSAPKWPNEEFKAKHESGTGVTVTPVEIGEPNLLPQSMRVGKGEPQELHWADREFERAAYVQKRWRELGFEPESSLSNSSLAYALLKVIDRLEARITQLENPKPPEGT